jgi:hypothetical protein
MPLFLANCSVEDVRRTAFQQVYQLLKDIYENQQMSTLAVASRMLEVAKELAETPEAALHATRVKQTRQTGPNRQASEEI